MSPQRDFRTRHDGFVLTDRGRRSSRCFRPHAALIVDALDDLGWRPVVKPGNCAGIDRLQVEDGSDNGNCLTLQLM